MSEQETIRIGELTAAAGDENSGAPVELPVVDVLTGRGFVTGKSGSGKSNTASVVIEELLDAGYPVLIVDTDGEYYGLKEEYELLHAGADEECDIQIGPDHAEKIANLALEENVPIILDVSGYLDEDVADELLRETARHLFTKEKKLKKPFLLVVEEVHEYLPQKGGGGETGKMLIKIGKRGRKHGLGIMGISQRPADVKKDFITQANWLVWHRLTWDNDTKVVGRVVDTEYQEAVSELADGEAFLQTDWTEVDVRQIQFRRKRTFDAGATPGLDDFERPELKSVSDSLMDDLETITEEEQQRESELADLQQELDKKTAKINQLEQDLENARDVSNAARQLANAFSRGDVASTPEEVESRLVAKDDRIEDLEDRVAELEDELDDAHEYIDQLEAENQRLQEATAPIDFDDPSTVQAAFPAGDGPETPGDADAAASSGDAVNGDATTGGDATTAEAAGAAAEQPSGDGTAVAVESDAEPTAVDSRSGDHAGDAASAEPTERTADDELDAESVLAYVRSEPIAAEVADAAERAHVDEAARRAIVEEVAAEGPLSAASVADRTDVQVQYVWTFLSELRDRPYLVRNAQGEYAFDLDALIACGQRVEEDVDGLDELLERFDA
ncbi:helicase HerA domain-containing protein [Natronoarchaeum mannanilyticum]|uniref:Helicase HerA central domain-containing protein n=1 Tax=Natronoarchaeum mannanilyticum TaxID=926360 RepID=A0AAV3TD60_9EURY